MTKSISPEYKTERQPESPFKLMLSHSVKVREAESDQRLYYFDNTIDLISVKISKKHIEPAHLHTHTTEIYYVSRGKLLLKVDGEAIWLAEGDLAIVYPGACHHFETTGEEVEFLAIKKEPGLDDKKSCT